jgi:hypothetical protein
MPNYSFRNVIDGTEYELDLTMSEREQYLKDNKDTVIQIIARAPSLGDSVKLGIRKPDQGFRDVLREIKKAHPRGGGVNTF